MFCNAAIELIKELRHGFWLPTYNEAKINDVVKEINSLYDSVNARLQEGDDVTSDKASVCTLLTQDTAIQRNKRCVLAYLNHRASAIKKLRWDCGAVIPEDCRQHLNEKEVQFFNEYDSLLGDYMSSIDMDLTVDSKPPKEVFITVRVLTDFGELETCDGTAYLHVNSTLYLRRSEVEHLIKQGVLEHVTN